MAGIAEVKSLAAQKQVLVAQSELYREELGIEIRDLKLAGTRLRKRFGFLGLLKPMILLAPIAGSLIGLRRPVQPPKPAPKGWRKWWGTALLGWRLYRRAAPVMGHFISRRNSRLREQQGRGRFTP